MAATDGTSRVFLLRWVGVRPPARALVVASVGFALAIGVLLVVRRAMGTLTAPLPAPQLVVTATALSAWAILVHEIAVYRRAVFFLSLCATLLVGIGCSYPGDRAVDWLVWIAALAAPLSPVFASRFTGQGSTKLWEGSLTPMARTHIGVRNPSDESERVLQRLERVRSAEGLEMVRGTLLAEFASGQRQTSLYVSFCPPFELLPQVEANVLDDAETEVKLAQVLHNGAQLDVRLSEPAEDALAVSIEFFASEKRKLAEEP